jgi:hypothetical protein
MNKPNEMTLGKKMSYINHTSSCQKVRVDESSSMVRESIFLNNCWVDWVLETIRFTGILISE